jgi:hypothetical protein
LIKEVKDYFILENFNINNKVKQRRHFYPSFQRGIPQKARRAWALANLTSYLSHPAFLTGEASSTYAFCGQIFNISYNEEEKVYT